MKTHDIERLTTNKGFNLVHHHFEDVDRNGRVVYGSRTPDAFHFPGDVLIAYPIPVRVDGIALQGQSGDAGWDVE